MTPGLGPAIDSPEAMDRRHEVKLLIAEALEMRTAACRLGGHASLTLSDCSPELLDAAERYGIRRTGRKLGADPADDTEWDYIAVCGGLVTFFGEHRAIAGRTSRGTGAPVDETEHTRSTVEMRPIAAGGGE